MASFLGGEEGNVDFYVAVDNFVHIRRVFRGGFPKVSLKNRHNMWTVPKT